MLGKINLTTIIFLFIILLSSSIYADDGAVSKENTLSPNQLLFEFDSRNYMFNLEYIGIPQREGETWFGDNLRLLFEYKAGSDITYTAGMFAAFIYGEQQFFNPIAPVVTFNYEPNKDFYLTLGTLDRKRHDLLDAIFDETLDFTRAISAMATVFRRVPLSNFTEYPRPLDNGVEIYTAHLRPFTLQTWGNWRYLDSYTHPNEFDTSVIALLDFKETTGIIINTQWHYIYRYGLLNNQGVTQGDNVCDAGISYNPLFLQNIKFSANILFSNADVNSKNLHLNGNGQEVRLDYNLYNWRLFTIYWNSKNFYAEDGNAMYQANTFWNFGFTRKIDITDGVNIAFGLTVYRIDDKFTHSEKVYMNFDKIFKLL
ncbi:MAG: hypothetical protein HQK91_05915 [Nitrospirae bacterium]|nr:hypothetical protein [Nitrospirota bacterium]